MLCEPLMQSMCSLRHQCHAHGSLPHPVHHCTTCAPEARRVVQAPLRADRNACSRARCAARAPLLYPRTTALPARRCPACAPEARRVVNALAEGIEMPARAPDAGSRSRSPLTHASPLELRSLLQVSPQLRGPIPGFPAAPLPIPGFPAEMAVIGQEYDGKPGIHTGSA